MIKLYSPLNGKIYAILLLISLNVLVVMSNIVLAQSITQAADQTVQLDFLESKTLWQNESFASYNQQDEIVGLRNEFSKHFRKDESANIFLTAAGRMHYWEDERWKTIFHTIEANENGFQNIYNSVKSYFPKVANQSASMQFEIGMVHTDMINMRMYYLKNGQILNDKPVEAVNGVSTKNILTYSKAYGDGIDIVLTQSTDQRKLDYVIASKSHLNIPVGAEFLVFEEEFIAPSGTTVLLVNNTIEIRKGNGELLLVYTNPLCNDTPGLHLHEDGHRHDAPNEYMASYELIDLGNNNYKIKTLVSVSWLEDDHTHYPVVIDPTASFSPNNATNWTGVIRSNGYTGAYYNNADNAMGVGRLYEATNSQYDYINYFPAIHSYAIFDLTTLPTSCVQSAALKLTVATNATSEAACIAGGTIRHISTDFTSASSTVYTKLTDIRDGDIYTSANFALLNPYNTGYLQTLSLNNNLKHVEDKSGSRFAVGLNTTQGATNHLGCYTYFYGHSSVSKPLLEVVYTVIPANPGNGINTWNVIAYNGSNMTVANNVYRGYYTQNLDATNNFGFDTENLAYGGWNNLNSPSYSSTYIGCPVNVNSMTYVHRRKGFPCATYRLYVNNWDDEIIVKLNGSTIFSCNGYSGAYNCGQTVTGNGKDLGIFSLDADDVIEVITNDIGTDSRAKLTITKFSAGLSHAGESRSCKVTGDQWVHFYTPTDGRYLGSIRGINASSNLGTVTLTSYDNNNPINVGACSNIDWITTVMERHFKVEVTNNGPAVIGLPYYGEEYFQLISQANANSNSNDNISSQADIKLSRYPGPNNLNGNPHDNCPAAGGSGNTTIHNPIAYGDASTHLSYVQVPAGEVSALYSVFEVPGFSEFYLHGSASSTPLGVNLKDLHISCEDGLMYWSTVSEVNASHFVVQRSRDGVEWEDVAVVPCTGGVNITTSYSFNQLIYGSYYRLKQQDYDGKTEYFGPLHVNCQIEKNEWMAFPNPTSGEFNVQITSTNTLGETEIIVVDLTGKIVIQDQINVKKGVTSITYDAQNLRSGAYIISVKSESMNDLKPIKLVVK